MSASTFLSTTNGYGNTLIGLALPASFTPPATCLGPVYTLGNSAGANNTLSSSSGSYFLTVGFNSACSPPGADRTGSGTRTASGAPFTSTVPYFSGSCPTGYAAAEGTHDLLPGVASTIAVCCPTASTTSYGPISTNLSPTGMLNHGGAGKCNRLAAEPVTVVSGSSTQILTGVSIVEQPIVVLAESSLPPLPGPTQTSTSVSTSSGSAVATYTILEVIPSTTSEFSVPTSCLEPTFTIGLDGYDSYDGSPTRGGSACYPEGYWLLDETLATESTATSLYYAQFYYPGTCPPGFNMAATDTFAQTVKSATSYYYGGWCCPNNWVIDTDESDYYCVTNPSASVTIIDTHTTMTFNNAEVSVMTYWPIGVASGTPAIVGAVPNMPSSTGGSSSDNSDLSTGASAGIGVGVALGVCLTALAAFLLWRRWRKSSLDTEKGNADPSLIRAELPTDGRKESVVEAPWSSVSEVPNSSISEAPDKAILEAPDGKPRPELDSMNVRAELEGDTAYAEAPANEVDIKR